MFKDIDEAINAFKKSKSVGVYCKDIKGLDKAMSVIVLSELSKKEGKTFQLFCTGTVKEKIVQILANENIQILKDPRSSNYIVSIDYGSTNIEKVVCNRNEETNKLNFVITPGDDLFSFDKVDLIPGGANIDLLFTLGISNLDEVEEAFRDLFSSSEIISITKKEGDVGKYQFLINGSRSYSEVLYEFLKAFSKNISEENLNKLLMGIVSKYKVFENNDANGWALVSNLIKYGANLTEVLNRLYYDKDKRNLDLQKKVMEKMLQDVQNRVIFSKISMDELQSCGIDQNNLDIKGKIVFNISREFDIAFVVYQLSEEKFKVVLESNNVEKYAASDLAEVFGSKVGSKHRAVFFNKSLSGKDFERKLLDALKDVFGIDVSNYPASV
jgi:nanoRNase/pAp phosphatase (c-di-AMP/oligoRNAs hydrolase)